MFIYTYSVTPTVFWRLRPAKSSGWPLVVTPCAWERMSKERDFPTFFSFEYRRPILLSSERITKKHVINQVGMLRL